MLDERRFDVIVIGAGGAGMMCAIEAGKRGRSVGLLDHSQKVGRKILISGGGRCNFTNIYAGPENYVSENPHFCKSALAQFSPDDFLRLVRKHRISFHEKKFGQLFCDDSAQAIVDLLLDECLAAGNVFRLGVTVNDVRKDDLFHLSTSHGNYACRSLVIATGGLSIPKIGATGFGYSLARKFALPVVETAPALVGFNMSQDDVRQLSDLAGVSIDCRVLSGKVAFRENILFTHTGLSGPAILQASLYWHDGEPLTIDLLPEQNPAEWLNHRKSAAGKMEMKNLLAELLPRRFAESFCRMNALHGAVSGLSEKEISRCAQLLGAWQVVPRNTFGYAKAEVTRGGVDTQVLQSKTMETKSVPGLYFVGEVVDVTGQLGGYNFQWAWASGFTAGQYV